MPDARRDVVVIGGGPAGSVAALLLARRGWDVTLVEQHRFPRDKVCGECLSALGMEVLDRHGLGTRVRGAGAVPLTSAAVHSAKGDSLRVALPAPMWGLSRVVLDGLLLEAAREAGATVRQPARCESLEGAPEAGERAVLRVRDLRSNVVETHTPSWVIVADGKASFGRTQPAASGDFGIKAHFENVDARPDCIELFGVSVGNRHRTYGGLAPIESARWNAAFSVPAAALREFGGDLGALFDRLGASNAALRARLRGATRAGAWLGSPLPRYPVSKGWPPNAVPIGNAAAALEPIGGEGMGLAIRSAEVAVEQLTAASGAEVPLDSVRLTTAYASVWGTRAAACRAAACVVSCPAAASTMFMLGRRSRPLVRLAMRLLGKRTAFASPSPRASPR